MYVHGPETRVYRTTLKRARQALAKVPDDAPDEVFEAANAAVDKAQEPLEWYQRLDIDAGIYDHQSDEF